VRGKEAKEEEAVHVFFNKVFLSRPERAASLEESAVRGAHVLSRDASTSTTTRGKERQQTLRERKSKKKASKLLPVPP
jgi:hypothetical protein